jgi:FMN phosphatase YigB (HAD superfamily)
MDNIQELHNKKYKYVFFDIFDTLVTRKVQPEYVKKIWANHLKKRFNLKKSIIEIYNIRNELEYTIGEKNSIKNNDWEFTYEQLLNKMYIKLNIKESIEIFKKDATGIEIEIEKNVQEVDKEIIKEIKKLKKEGKKIYCISDMYLSKKMIEEIFSSLGIKDLFDDIFISCEYLKNKKSGQLYELVLSKIKTTPDKCIMIGDNYNSDYKTPINLGIHAIHLDRSKNYNKYERFEENNTKENILEKFTKLLDTPTDNFEHSIFTLYKFIEKLYYSLQKDGLEEVFFLSREGEYLKKLFDAYQDTVYGKKIKSNYILVSRKATYLPSLKELEKEDFGGLLKQYVYINLEEFLGSLNLSKEDKDEILNSFAEDCKKLVDKNEFNENEKKEIEALANKAFDKKIIYLYESKVLVYLKKNKKFKEIYEKNRTEQNLLFKKYIKQHTDNKKICVVDIGWNGSIQDNIQNILGDEYQVTGYLYGLVTRENPNEVAKENNKHGLIFSNVPKISKNFELFIENRTIYEILLGASHGSANRYIEKNGKIEVLTFEKKEERAIYNDVISKIQNDMFKIYIEMVKLLQNTYYDDKIIDKKINQAHFKMVFYPTEEQLKFFNKIYHYENFGVFEFTEFNLQKKLDLKYYIKENLKYFIKHKSFFYDAFWPVLKLYNEKLYIQQKLYISGKRRRLKRKGVI